MTIFSISAAGTRANRGIARTPASGRFLAVIVRDRACHSFACALATWRRRWTKMIPFNRKAFVPLWAASAFARTFVEPGLDLVPDSSDR